MNEIFMVGGVFLGGVLMGAFFFGGLWWTISRGIKSNIPAIWFLASLIIRTAVTVTGFYLIAGEQWLRLVVCLIGFLVARGIAKRILRVPLKPEPQAIMGANIAA